MPKERRLHGLLREEVLQDDLLLLEECPGAERLLIQGPDETHLENRPAQVCVLGVLRGKLDVTYEAVDLVVVHEHVVAQFVLHEAGASPHGRPRVNGDAQLIPGSGVGTLRQHTAARTRQGVHDEGRVGGGV